jgi:hypothetical protein
MLDGLLTWTAHSEHQEVWAGPSWSSYAFKVRSVLLPGSQDPSKSVLLKICHTPERAQQLMCRHARVKYDQAVLSCSHASSCLSLGRQAALYAHHCAGVAFVLQVQRRLACMQTATESRQQQHVLSATGSALCPPRYGVAFILQVQWRLAYMHTAAAAVAAAAAAHA